MHDIDSIALPPEVDAALDALLARWAADSALSKKQVAAIRERVLASDAAWRPALGVGWWQSLGATLGATIARSTQALCRLGRVPAGNGTLTAQVGR